MVGRVGRRMLKERIPYYVNKYEIDFVIANGENTTHGKGLNRNHYFELLDAGVDVITLGNHYMSKSDILRHRQADKLPIRILKNSSDMIGNLKQSETLGLFSADFQTAALLPLI